MDNFIFLTDSYKFTHFRASDPTIEKTYSYLESRGGFYDKTVFFGLQYYLKKYLAGVRITKEMIDQAELFANAHFGRTDCFNRAGWEYIVEKHGGKLPIRIMAVPEGLIIPTSNVLMTIENTDGSDWLTNYVETLLMKIWYTITQATRSYYIRKNMLKHLEKSGTPESIDFKCHDFGYRGVTSEEQAALGTASHLLSFMGTDTIAGILMLQKYYNAEMCGFSIPATEHSIICGFGTGIENEIKACENFLDQFSEGTIACVSDTNDIFNSCENIWGGVLKDKIMKRNGTLVIRPDSGNPVDIICGTGEKITISNDIIKTEKGKLIRKAREAKDVIINFKEESPSLYNLAIEIINGKKVEDKVYSSEDTDNQKIVYNYFEVKNNEIVSIGEERVREGGWYWFKDEEDLYETITIVEKGTPKEYIQKGVMEILWDKFGGTVNEKGYKVLDSHVRIIQGDGMNPETIDSLYTHIMNLGWSADNLTVGSGGGLLMKNIDRDTCKFAIKASAVQKNGEWIGIQKDPITDKGKRSKMGRLKLIKENGEYKTVSFDSPGENILVPVFEDGVILKEYTLDDVKQNMLI